MFQIEYLPIVLTGIGIIVSILYYTSVLRNANKTQQMQLETRQAQMFMQIYSQVNSIDFKQAVMKMQKYNFENIDEFLKTFNLDSEEGIENWHSIRARIRFTELMNMVTNTFIQLGAKPENIEKHDLYKETPPNIQDKDVIFMWGGNENHYINRIRKLGLESELHEFIEGNGVYVGVSAGAIIMGPTVDIEYWSNASNDIGLVDKFGLGFVDFIVVPHVDTRDSPERVIEFHKQTGYKMIYLTDKQGILVKDNMYKII